MRATVHWWLTGCGRRMSRLNTLVVTPPPRLSSSTSHPILFALRFSPFFFNVSVLSPPPLSSPSIVPRQPEPAENNSSPRTKGGEASFLRAPFPVFPQRIRKNRAWPLSLSLSPSRDLLSLSRANIERRRQLPGVYAYARLVHSLPGSSKQNFRDRTSRVPRFIARRNVQRNGYTHGLERILERILEGGVGNFDPVFDKPRKNV